MAAQPTSGVVLISEGAYRLLLHLYPRHYRDEWGLHMSRTFRDHSREQYQRYGLAGLAGLWMLTAVDVVKTALEERARDVVKTALEKLAKTREWSMSNETTIRIGGAAMILGGVLWLVANLGHMPMEYFGGIDFDPVWIFAFPPLLFGLYALTVFAGPSYPMRAAAWIAVVSGAVAYLGVIGSEAAVFLGLVLLMVLAMLSFGMSALREKPLPRWNGVGLLLVAPLVAIVIFNVLSGQLPPETVSGIFANVALTTTIGLIGLCWVLLGCAMLPPRNRAAEPGVV